MQLNKPFVNHKLYINVHKGAYAAFLSTLGFFVIVSTTLRANADALDTWHWRNPIPTGGSMRSVTFGNGRFVTVGQAGVIANSTNGFDWSCIPSVTSNALNAVTYGSSLFVAVGDNGVIETSSDGSNWVARLSPTSASLRAAAFGNGTFVGVGDAGTIVSSKDGVNWANQSAPATTNSLIELSYGNGLFVALFNETGNVLTSSDGINWTKNVYETSPFLEAPGLAFGNGQFFISASVTPNGLFTYTSTNGLSWTARRAPPAIEFSGNKLPLFGNGRFFLLPLTVNDSNEPSSTNGVDWINATNTGYTGGRVGVYGNGTFVLVGNAIIGGGGLILTSPDGFAWTNRIVGMQINLSGVAYGAGKNVAVGASAILISSNGLSYQPVNTPFTGQIFTAINYGSNGFTVVGAGGTILQSVDGLAWAQRNSGTTFALHGITQGGAVMVAVGDQGRIQTSPTGQVWTGRFSGIDLPLYGISYGNGVFVAVGDQGSVLTSSDGVSWTSQDSGGLTNLRAVTYAQTGFVAVGSGGVILTSPDGVNWISRNSGVAADLISISNGGGFLLAFGNGAPYDIYGLPIRPVLLSSIDGVNWTPRNTGDVELPYAGSGFLNNRFVGVGVNGLILESDEIITALQIQAQLVGKNIRLTFPAVPGSVIRIQGCPSATSGNWSDLATVTNQTVLTSWDDSTSNASQRFYRLVSP